jgi:hypothetical protein
MGLGIRGGSDPPGANAVEADQNAAVMIVERLEHSRHVLIAAQFVAEFLVSK